MRDKLTRGFNCNLVSSNHHSVQLPDRSLSVCYLLKFDKGILSLHENFPNGSKPSERLSEVICNDTTRNASDIDSAGLLALR